MNKENIQKLIDHIKTHENQFDMNYVIKSTIPPIIAGEERDSSFNSDGERLFKPSHCGTVCCMLGWTNAISTNFEDNCYRRFHDVRKASQFLGIHVQYAAKLFFPGSGLVEEMDRGNPWYQAHDRGLIDINSLRNSDCYNASASVAITVLEGIRDEVIFDIMFDED